MMKFYNLKWRIKKSNDIIFCLFSDSYGAPTAPLVQPEPVSNTQTYSQYPSYSDGSVTYDTPVTFAQPSVQYPSAGPYQAPASKTLFFQFIAIEIDLFEV